MGVYEFVATDGGIHRWRKRENVFFKKVAETQKEAALPTAEK